MIAASRAGWKSLGVVELWNNARVGLYEGLSRRLPAPVRAWIGASTLTVPLRRWLLWPRGLGTLVETPVEFCGHRFRFAATVKVVSTIRRRGGIESGICRLVLKECGPGAVALDVGASYGFVSLVMASAVGSSGHVYAFEADPRIAEATRANVARNDLEERCTVVQAFVGRSAGHERRIAIDDYVAAAGLTRLDLIKVDVDGPDLEVLEGARASLEQFHPIVVIEMTGNQAGIFRFLQELGYECSDVAGTAIQPGAWPPNLFAAVGRRLRVPTADEVRVHPPAA